MRVKILAFCLLATLSATACGSRLPSDVLQAIDSRTTAVQTSGGGPVDGAGAAAERSSGGNVGTSVASGRLSNTANEASGPRTGGAVNATAKCNQARSAAPGVSDDEIKVASIVTDSGPLPGATEGSYRGAAAYFAMVNAAGGVCGRKITLLKGDDGLDPAKARGEFLRLEPDVFGFVGAFAVADSGYVDLIESTGVPYVSLVVEPEGRKARNVFWRLQEGVVNAGPMYWFKKQHPNVKKAALLYADVGGVSANIPGFEKAMEKAGFDRRYTAAADVTSPDFTPEVQQAQDEGIEFFYLFAFEVSMHVRMVRNMRQQNYDPPIKGANIAFNTRFSELLGKQGDGWENHNTHLIFLDPAERARSEKLAQFIDWNERVFPGAQLDLFPVSGWEHAAVFVDAMQRIQGDITRDALVDALYTLKETSGGIEAPFDPSTGVGDSCFNIAIHRGGHWVREYPTDKLFDCNRSYSFKFR